jgi:folate-binding protein YgfZ
MNTTYGLLKITGPDAKKFLQGQLTCNLDEVTEEPRLGAHCNPQGRIISLFRIFLKDENYFLQMPPSMIPIALKALKKYAVFFKVELSDASSEIKISEKINQQNKQAEIENGIAEIYPETSEKFLPHELNLPTLGGVSFNKGCFTGQEIIARMQYRGKLKTRLFSTPISSDTPPQRGADFSQGIIVDYCQLGYNSYLLLVLGTK